MFALVADMRSRTRSRGLRQLHLSMTHTVADVLGAYVLAKESGLFSTTPASSSALLPIVPLFETIPDLRAAPVIMRELLRVPLVRRSTH